MSSPLTAEEVDKLARKYLWQAFWLERNTGELEVICMDMIGYASRGKILVYKKTDPHLNNMSMEYFYDPFVDYDKDWRLWDSEPTEEERKSAEWKTA